MCGVLFILYVLVHTVVVAQQNRCPFSNCTCTETHAVCQQIPVQHLPAHISHLKVMTHDGVLKASDLSSVSFIIKDLDLRSTGITGIEPDTFYTHPQLEILRLSNNDIPTIATETFKNNGNLRHLYLDNSGIRTLGRNCFGHLNKLKSLYLQKNHLTTIPRNLPEKIETLDLSNNKMIYQKNIEEPLDFQPDLRKLDLCGNPIEHFPMLSLRTCNKLETLCIGDKPTRMTRGTAQNHQALRNLTFCAKDQPGARLDIETQAELAAFEHLQELTICYYTLTSLMSLDEKKELEVLKLEHVQLDGVMEDDWLIAFIGKENIKKLILTGSTQVAHQILSSHKILLLLKNLEELNLSYTQQKHLTALNKWSGTSMKLDISFNPLVCNCKLRDILKQQRFELLNSEHTHCEAPQSFLGIKVEYLLEENTECEDTTDEEESPNVDFNLFKDQDKTESVESDSAEETGTNRPRPRFTTQTPVRETMQDEDETTDYIQMDATEEIVTNKPKQRYTRPSKTVQTAKHDNHIGYEEEKKLDHTATYIILGLVILLLIVSIGMFIALYIYYKTRKNYSPEHESKK